MTNISATYVTRSEQFRVRLASLFARAMGKPVEFPSVLAPWGARADNEFPRNAADPGDEELARWAAAVWPEMEPRKPTAEDRPADGSRDAYERFRAKELIWETWYRLGHGGRSPSEQETWEREQAAEERAWLSTSEHRLDGALADCGIAIAPEEFSALSAAFRRAKEPRDARAWLADEGWPKLVAWRVASLAASPPGGRTVGHALERFADRLAHGPAPMPAWALDERAEVLISEAERVGLRAYGAGA